MSCKLAGVGLLVTCVVLLALTIPQSASGALDGAPRAPSLPGGLASSVLAPDLLPHEGAAGALISRRVEQPPEVDGIVDSLWASVEPLHACMTMGRDSLECAFDVELRSVYTDNDVYFLAEWRDVAPTHTGGTIHNKLTLHFDLPEPWPGARDVTCLVACHTGFVNDQGQVVYVSAETIPPGRTDPLPAAGQWQDGTWRLEWVRPLMQTNGFDVQFDDPDGQYPFFVKVFEWREGHPDPTSHDYVLVFRP
ncbi:MAG: hypothetical protein JXA74_13230 [Anaerolineae bacterium]|nr:hypothetical protein [Anaerolineae bacterium]